MTKMISQQQRHTDGASTPKKVSTALQAPQSLQLPHSSTEEPATPQAAQQHTLHATPGTPMVSPAAVAHAEATATAIARARLRAGSSPKAALADAAAGSTLHALDPAASAADAADAAYHFPTVAAPAGAAAAARAARVVERGAAAAGRAAGRLSKYASQPGLHGIAEAAGHVLGELAPAAAWRQDVLLTRLAAGLALALTLGYVLLLAPRSLGWREEMRLVLRHFGADNAVAFALINLLGFFPAILGCVAWPLLRSTKHKPPLWRYLLASTMTGAFALLSYLAAWDPPRPGRAARLPPQHLTGRTRWLQRAYESRLFPASLLASSVAMIALAANSSAATWAQFGYLASHSFTFNVMLLDFSLLTLLSAWLVVRDAAARGWQFAGTTTGRRFLQAAMLLTPVVGPGLYLLLRPVSKEGGLLRRGWLRRSVITVWAAVKYPFSLPAGGIGGRVGAAAAGVGRPAHSTNSRSQQGAANGAVHVPAHRRDIANAVAHAAAVPLPAAGAAGAAVGAARQWVESAWFNGWSWLGQKVARFRGGGAPVASEDEVAGDELDAMDDGEIQINHTAEGTATTHDHTDAASPPAAPNPFAGLSLRKLGALLIPHVPHQQQQQQQGWELGPNKAPRKGKDDEGGTDMLLFSDDYDEFEYDYDASSSSDDEDDDESAGWEGESDDEDDEEGFEPEGFGSVEGFGLGEGFEGFAGGPSEEELWQQRQQALLLQQQQQQQGADDMDIDEDLATDDGQDA